MRYLCLFLCVFSLGWADQVGKVLLEKRYKERDQTETRVYEDVIIDCGPKGKAHFTISLPKTIPEKGLPCIVIVGGLVTGRDSLRFIPDHGDYALIAYEYPKTLKKLWKVNILWELLAVRRTLLDVPDQLIEMIRYINERLWMGNDPVNLMGYSFGATFVPVTYVKAEDEGLKLGPGVMAYGGAGLYCIIKANLHLPKFLRSPVAAIEAALFKPIDPLLYAHRMKGDFLLINGKNDTRIPYGCATRLQELVPEPKTILNLDTGHLHPDNTELTLRIINLSRDWIEEKRQK